MKNVLITLLWMLALTGYSNGPIKSSGDDSSHPTNRELECSEAEEDLMVACSITDQTVTAFQNSVCPGSGTSIYVSASQPNVNYYLRDNQTLNVIDGPIPGNGSSLSFSTGSLFQPTTFQVYASEASSDDRSLMVSTSSIGSYVTINNSPSLQLSENWTIEAWVKPTGVNEMFIVETYNGSGGFALRTTPQGQWRALAMQSSTVYNVVTSTSFVNSVLNQWTHVAATFNETTNELKIYVNGVLDGTNASATVDQRGSTTSIKLGARGDDSARGVAHQLDEVRIWNIERTAQEINDNKSLRLAGSESGLVAYYNFDSPSFASDPVYVYDRTSNGNHGTMSGTWQQTDFKTDVPLAPPTPCELVMSTTQTITPEDTEIPNAVVKDLTISLGVDNLATITPADINYGSGDNCTGTNDLVLSLDKDTFGCEDVGQNTVTLTVTDAAGNSATATATVTVNADFTITDKTVTATSTAVCSGGSTTIRVENTQADVLYSLRDDQTLDVVDGPYMGIAGLYVDFNTGAITQTTTYQVYAEPASQGDRSAKVGWTGYVEIPNSPSLQLSENWTLEAWVKPANATNDLNIIETYDANGGFILRANGGKYVAYAMGSHYSIASSTTGVVADQWTHVAATFNETTDELKIYINGQLDATLTTATTDQRGSNATIKLGARGDDEALQGEHLQDEIRIWNVERTAQEISDNMSKRLPQTVGLVGYYTYNNAAFSATDMVIADMSGNNNDGTMRGTYLETDFTTDVPIATFSSCNVVMSTKPTVTVSDQDNEAPIAVAQNVVASLQTDGTVTIDAASVDNGSSDNCTDAGSLVFSLSKSAFACEDLGENVVTFTVTDESGNQATSTVTITIEDKIAPTALAKNITVRLDANNSVDVFASDIDNGSIDNCGNVTLVITKGGSGTKVAPPQESFVTFSDADLGPNTVTLTVTDDSGNSFNTTAIVTVEAYKESQTITFNAIADKVYGDSPFNVEATASSALAVGLEVTSGPATLSGNTVTITGAGTVTITATQPGNETYLAATPVSQSFTVSPASLTITADDKSMTYGDPLPELTYSTSGFVNGEDVSVLTNQPVLETSAVGDGGSDAGEYVIEVTTATADNYAITFVSGTLTINKASQTITVEPVADKLTTDEPFNIVASVDTGLPLTYTITGPATINEGTVTLDGTEGTVTITVAQAGTVNYTAASQDVSFEVRRPLAAGVASQVEIYPNPALNWLYIDAPEMVEVSIVTLEGRVVLKQSIQKGQLDVSHLSEGMYLLTLATDEGIVSKKIVKR